MLFFDPVGEIKATSGEQLQAAFKDIDQYRRDGYHLAGYINYEAAYELINKLSGLGKSRHERPLLQFFAFAEPVPVSDADMELFLDTPVEREPYLQKLQHSIDQETYLRHLAKIKQYIYDGDTYQVNYTFRMHFQLQGDVISLYRTLRERQAVEFSALLLLPEMSILSLSPELFVQKTGKTLTTKPMKGTYPRGDSLEEDERITKSMAQDTKQLSENLMIVDLMRNDIGRLAKTGSMRVKNLFEIQTFKTLHQMISTIQGDVDKAIPLSEIMDGLFPCGSITGAPKIRTMEIIKELETTERGIYTGAIGYITPENDFTFNVPIRTIEFPDNTAAGQLGIGGGIIHESDAAEEWDECLLKAQFLTGINKDFSLIETCRYDCKANRIERLEQHLQRMARSAEFFQFKCNLKKIRQQIDHEISTYRFTGDQKIRMTLNSGGVLDIRREPITNARSEKKRLCISKTRIHADSVFRKHKTSRRRLYNTEYNRVTADGFYDVLFLNEQDQLAEASRHNLVLLFNKYYYTPPILSGALPGIYRQSLIEDKNFPIKEKNLTISDLESADAVFLCNSVRGLVEVEFGG